VRGAATRDDPGPRPARGRWPAGHAGGRASAP
jgi:hypothetical protein